MAQADIAVWVEKVKELNILKDRGGGDADWVHVGGTDGSIFELRRADTYTRAVWSQRNPPERPFAYWFFGSRQFPEFPKTEFFGSRVPPEYLTAEEVLDRLDILP